MKLIQTNPVYVNLEDLDDFDLERLQKTLAYQDLSAKYAYDQARKNKWGYQYNQHWAEHVATLKTKINKTALFEDKDGTFKTYAGLIEALRLNDYEFEYENQLKYPRYKSIPYALNYKPYKLYKHQEEVVEALLKHKHAAAQAPTGSGKTLVIEEILHRTGYSAVIVVPSKSIAGQFYEQLVKAFGKSKVGIYGGGKKEYKKHITVAIGASLCRLEDGCPEQIALNSKDLLVYDEAHLCGAPTVSSIAQEVLRSIPVRYSVSATPERADGQDTMLTGIIGPVIYSVDFNELVKCGVLAKLNFYVYNVESHASYSGQNAKKNSQEHLLYNADVLQLAAKIASMKVINFDEPTIILIEEKEQLDYLKPFLKTTYEFAHSGSDVAQQVKDFNAGKFKLLVGTSAISTGTDTKVVKNLILLFSGKSTIKFKQAIGRGTRIVPGKSDCSVFDFNVVNDNQSARHFQHRLAIYQSMSDTIVFRQG